MVIRLLLEKGAYATTPPPEPRSRGRFDAQEEDSDDLPEYETVVGIMECSTAITFNIVEGSITKSLW